MNLCDRLLVLSKGVLAGEVVREHYDEEAILGLAYSEYLKAPHDAAAVA
jgi:ribose transport system ATP-binding protein